MWDLRGQGALDVHGAALTARPAQMFEACTVEAAKAVQATLRLRDDEPEPEPENEPEPEGVAEQPSISLHEHLEEEEHVWSTQGVFAGSRHYL